MGLLGHFKDSVTLVNRTSRSLNVRYDGEDITLPPGEIANFPKIVVPYAKKQNPLMGSKHPIDPRKCIYLVGVKAKPGQKQKDDISPIDDQVLKVADNTLEVIDRDGKFWGDQGLRQIGNRPGNVRLLKKTPFTAYEAQAAIDPDFSAGNSVE